MNGTELMNNLIDELNRSRDLCDMLLRGEEISSCEAEELIEDIRVDLDRYYDIADAIDACICDIDVT